jgi:hypothetical protein
MRQAGLPIVDPVLIYPIAIAHQQTRPILYQIEKGLFGAPRMNHIEGHLLTGHHPQPFQGILTVPGCFINITHPCLTRLRGNQHVIRIDRQGHPVDHLLNGA